MCLVDIIKCHRCEGGFLTNVKRCPNMVSLCQNVITTFDRSFLKPNARDTRNVTIDDISSLIVIYIKVFGAEAVHGKCIGCDKDYPGMNRPEEGI
jgi:hypothetical protein